MNFGISMSDEQVELRKSYLAAFVAANPDTKPPVVCVGVSGWWYVGGVAYRKSKLVEMRDRLLARVSAAE